MMHTGQVEASTCKESYVWRLIHNLRLKLHSIGFLLPNPVVESDQSAFHVMEKEQKPHKPKASLVVNNLKLYEQRVESPEGKEFARRAAKALFSAAVEQDEDAVQRYEQMITLGQTVQFHRREKGLTRRYVSKQLAIDYDVLWFFESGLATDDEAERLITPLSQFFELPEDELRHMLVQAKHAPPEKEKLSKVGESG